MQEEWKDIPGYINLYKVSSFGRVKGLKSGKILRPGLGTNGYWLVVLSKNGKIKTTYLHRLVAKIFIGPALNNLEVNHIDANRANNSANNLEYVTHKQNIAHSNGLNRRDKEKAKSTKINKNLADEIRALYKTGSFNQQELADRFSLARNSISQIVNFYTWK